MLTQSKKTTPQPGPNTGWKRLLPRAEGASLIAMSVLLYRLNGAGRLPFALGFLAPDLSLLGYAAGSEAGDVAYAVSHAYPLPSLLAAYGLVGGSTSAVGVALAWFAHIGMDRTLGLGLK